jgi:malonate transporter and related proteins
VNAVIGALLPLIVTLALGFFAAWRHEFSPGQALVLNRVVLLYALPLLLFAGTVTIKRGTLTGSLGLAAAITAAMVGAYLVTFLVVRLALHRPLGVSALTALAIGGPAVPFAGVVVLGYLYRPSVSAVPVAVGALVFNVIEVPVTLVLLSVAAGSSAAAGGPPPRVTTAATTPATKVPALVPAYAAGAGENDDAMRVKPASASQAGSPTPHSAASGSLGQHVLSAIEQPVVIAPILALGLVVAGIEFPPALLNATKLLGSATTGVALFATGIVLYAQRITVSRFVVGAVAMRNIVVPALLWIILVAIGLSHTDVRLAVLANALPAPVAAVIFAVQYKQGQREMASVVLFSSVFSLLSLAAFITLT